MSLVLVNPLIPVHIWISKLKVWDVDSKEYEQTVEIIRQQSLYLRRQVLEEVYPPFKTYALYRDERGNVVHTLADHLPRPRKFFRYASKAEDLVMAYECSEPYDPESFLGYPSRQGFLFDGNSGDEVRASRGFYQNWLILGFLSDCLGINAKEIERTLIWNEDIAPVIGTHHLPRLLSHWYDRSSRLSGSVREVGIVDRIKANIFAAKSAIQALESRGSRTSSLKDWELSLCSLLISWIHRTAFLTYTGRWSKSERPTSDKTTLEILNQQLLRQGSCESTITKLHRLSHTFMSFPALFLHHALFMMPPGSESTVTADQLRKKHGTCTENTCRAANVDEEHYETAHSENCSNRNSCKWFSASTNELMDCLDRKAIPLIQIAAHRDDENSTDGISVVRARENTTFVAISHVWSDGLGNPMENSLPMCQINKMLAGIRRLSHWRTGPVRIWVDTLCCPVTNPRGRKMAIQLMQHTYDRARDVYVIEYYISAHEVKKASFDEIAMILAFSEHQRRLWTLSETICGLETVQYHFKDLTLSAKDLLAQDTCAVGRCQSARHLGIWSVNGAYPLIPETSTLLAEGLGEIMPHRILHEFRSERRNPLTLRLLEKATRFRQTSRAKDEAVCLAHILRLSNSQQAAILEAPTDSGRMLAFWFCLGEVPPEIVFWGCTKLSKKGFRWAPRSLLSVDDIALTPDHKRVLARTCSAGLQIEDPAWLFELRGALPEDDFFVIDKYAPKPFFRLHPKLQHLDDQQALIEFDALRFAHMGFAGADNLAILLNTDGFSPDMGKGYELRDGLLVQHNTGGNNTGGSTKFATTIAPYHIRSASKGWRRLGLLFLVQKITHLRKMLNEEQNRFFDRLDHRCGTYMLTVRRISQRRWCVD